MSDTERRTDGRTDTTTKTAEDGKIESVDAIADDIDPDEIWDTENEDIGIYDYQRHRNGDVTALLLCSFAGGWQAFAFDVDSAGEVLETEVVGSATEHSRAIGMCEYWLQQNPEGILGGEPEDEGFFSRLFGGGDA